MADKGEISGQTGKRQKSPKGTVKVELDKGWLRLRFMHQGKRYTFALGLPDSKVNRTIAEQKALQITKDIDAGHFDQSLNRYKPERQSESKVELLTVAALFQSFVEHKAKDVSLKTLEKYRATLRYVSEFFPNKPVESLDTNDAGAFAQSGKAIDDHNFSQRIWKKVLEKLGIPYRKLYNTRHTFASHALEAKMNPILVSEITGHDKRVLLNDYAGIAVSKLVYYSSRVSESSSQALMRTWSLKPL